MKRPAFQFYPDNWRNNSNLRRCSWAARGVWVEVICLMHDADEYGVLPWSLKEIALALGAPMPLLRELVEKGVLKGCDEGECEPYIYTPRSGRKDGAPVTLVAQRLGPVWYSSRMVRDEYVRLRSGGATRFGSNRAHEDCTEPAAASAPKPSPSRRQGERRSDGASTPSPSSENLPPSPPSEVRSPRGSRLPSDWQPSEEMIAFGRDLGIDVQRTAAKFRDYWHARAGSGGVKLDWSATWRNWCREEVGRHRPASRPPDNARPSRWDIQRQVFDEMGLNFDGPGFDGVVIEGEQ